MVQPIYRADTEVLTGSHGNPTVEINRRKPHGRQSILVDLTEEEREDLLNVIDKGKAAARKVARAHCRREPQKGRRMRPLPKRSTWEFRPCIALANGLSTKG